MNTASAREIDLHPDPGVTSSNPRGGVSAKSEIKAVLLTGGIDRHYAYGFAMAMVSNGVSLDIIGGDEVDSPELHSTPGLNFLNLHGKRREGGLGTKISAVLNFYWRLLRYAARANRSIFHILWNNYSPLFDRTALMAYYKLLGKKVVFTAHNVNAGRRDGNNSFFNRFTLWMQYRLADHILVHTDKMKADLFEEFRVPAKKVTVIPYGINNAVPDTELTTAGAKEQLGIAKDDKTILFFGRIRPYKGIEHLVGAFQRIAAQDGSYRLIVAGEPKKGSEQYLQQIQDAIQRDSSGRRVIQTFEFIPDEETELYFKAADVLVLPYTLIFQSGILFLAYSFGLPVIATDVGSFRDYIVPGQTGFVARSCSAGDLAEVIETYFASDLYGMLNVRRPQIREYARARCSWNVVAETTRSVYVELLGR